MKKYSLIFSTFLLGLILTSCLKDKNITEQKYGLDGIEGGRYVGIETSALSGVEGYSSDNVINLPFSNTDTTFELLTVRLFSNEPAQQDITVTLDTSYALVRVFNDSNDTHLETPPSSIYQLPDGLTVKIPKGQKEGTIRMTLKPSDLVNMSYALGFRIKSISDPSIAISENYIDQVVSVGVKNKYDAIYELKTRMRAGDRPTVNTSTVWVWPYDVSLITSGTSTNKMYAGGYDLFARPIETNTNDLSRFGSVEPKFHFDLATDKIINVTNDFPNPPNGRQLELDPTGPNYFDPATRNIYATYIMTQPGFGPLQISDTLTFVKER